MPVINADLATAEPPWLNAHEPAELGWWSIFLQSGCAMSSRVSPADRVYVAGHRGMVGSAVWRHLESVGFTDLVGRTSGELDLRDRDATFAFFDEARPQVVVDAAARVGGI